MDPATLTQNHTTLTRHEKASGTCPELAQSSAMRGSHDRTGVAAKLPMDKSHWVPMTPPIQARVILTRPVRTAARPDTEAHARTDHTTASA